MVPDHSLGEGKGQLPLPPSLVKLYPINMEARHTLACLFLLATPALADGAPVIFLAGTLWLATGLAALLLAWNSFRRQFHKDKTP